MEDSIGKQQKVVALSVLHFEVFLQYVRKYYRKYLDNGYMKVYTPKSMVRGDYNYDFSVTREKWTLPVSLKFFLKVVYYYILLHA